jgi:putative flavoprotein involved in K+ transport
VNEKIDTVIIGAGHAGLTMSYFLSERGLEHVIVERGRVGERWISERWDSFHFQFPNWTIELPGYKYQTEDPDGFVPGREIVRFIQEYSDFIKAPVRSGVDVTALENSSNSMPYVLRTNAGAIEASNVVIATGQREKGVIPPFSSDVPNDIRRCFRAHTAMPVNCRRGPYWLWGVAHRAFKSLKTFINMVDGSTSAWVAIGALRDATAVATTPGGRSSWDCSSVGARSRRRPLRRDRC